MWQRLKDWLNDDRLRYIDRDLIEHEVAIRELQQTVEKIETWIKEHGGNR